MKRAAIAVLVLVSMLWAEDKKPDACAALRLENAQLKLQVANLKDQLIQAQGALMQQEYQRVQEEKQKADAELKAEKAKQGNTEAQSQAPPKK